MTFADMAWAHAEQTRIFRRFQITFRDYDLVLSPTVSVSPIPLDRALPSNRSKGGGCAITTNGLR